MIPIPWRVKHAVNTLVNALHFLANRCRSARRAGIRGLKVQYCIPPYGHTGGSFAVMSVANLISESVGVRYMAGAANVMNRYAAPTVALDPEVAPDADICVIEGGEDPARIVAMRARGARIIVTMHGNPRTAVVKNSDVDPENVARVLSLVDSAHFVAPSQTEILTGHPMLHRRLIPNFVDRVAKTRRTRNAGIVCDTRLGWKRALAALAAAEGSTAAHVHVWGRNSGERSTGRVTWHGFSADKAAVFNSFDVLVHLSLHENGPLVVLEAMSAGIACVLGDQPNYARYRGVPGIYLVGLHDAEAARLAVNEALERCEETRGPLIVHWEANYSPQALKSVWLDYFDEVRRLPACYANH